MSFIIHVMTLNTVECKSVHTLRTKEEEQHDFFSYSVYGGTGGGGLRRLD